MIRDPKPICRHPLDFNVTITLTSGMTLKIIQVTVKVNYDTEIVKLYARRHMAYLNVFRFSNLFICCIFYRPTLPLVNQF